MTARQPEIMTEKFEEYAERARYYTADEKLNKMFNDCAREAGLRHVWISIDGADLQQNILGHEFERLLELALTQSLETCVLTTSPERRFLKVRSMSAQKRVFVKIMYSCEEPVMAGFDRRCHQMQEIVDKVDGYMRLQFTEDENILKIAVPM